MSVLNTKEILRSIRNRELVVSPILSIEQIESSVSIDLRLGNVAIIVRSSSLSHINPSEYHIAESSELSFRRERGRRQKFERHEIPFLKPLLLHPNNLVLVPTLEWIKLPSNLKGIVTARSSWAREGLNIATANFINPGYNGIITLELCNFGQIPIEVYPGMRIAQVAFQRTRAVNSKMKKSQFNLSFEPQAGFITKGDEAFVPLKKRKEDKDRISDT